jgi:hypothetical protein
MWEVEEMPTICMSLYVVDPEAKAMKPVRDELE